MLKRLANVSHLEGKTPNFSRPGLRSSLPCVLDQLLFLGDLHGEGIWDEYGKRLDFGKVTFSQLMSVFSGLDLLRDLKIFPKRPFLEFSGLGVFGLIVGLSVLLTCAAMGLAMVGNTEDVLMTDFRSGVQDTSWEWARPRGKKEDGARLCLCAN
jgi:hypothetical protein